MNLNEFVPTHLEDASGIHKDQTVFLLSGKSSDEILLRPDIRYGLSKHIQLEAMADFLSGEQEARSGESRLALQYMINEVNDATPVVAIVPFIALPTGKKSEGSDMGAKLILTSTVRGSSEHPEMQIHLNYQLRHNASRLSGERAEEGSWAIGFSRLISEKLVFVSDIINQEEGGKSERQDFFEAGIHQKMTKTFYLSYGIGKGLNHSSPEWMGLVSLEFER